MFDVHLQALQNLEPFNVYALTKDGSVVPWYDVTGSVLNEVVLNENNVGEQVQLISAQIAHWARLKAQAKRVWEIEERHLRMWKARKYLEFAAPDGTKDWKKPTEKNIESQYRLDVEYGEMYSRSERAEEAYESASGILDAFKAKREMLKIVVRRNKETSEPELSI